MVSESPDEMENKAPEADISQQQPPIAPETDIYDLSLSGIDYREEDKVQIISFLVEDEEYALGIGEVKEVIRAGEIVEVPHSQDIIRGIIYLRGEVIPVLDLKRRLNLGESGTVSLKRIVITQYEDVRVGMAVEKIVGVEKILNDEIEVVPILHSDTPLEFLKGVVHIDQRLVILLDLGKLIDIDTTVFSSSPAVLEGEVDGDGR